MGLYHAPLSTDHTVACVAAAGILLRDGISVVRFDAVNTDQIGATGPDEVRDIFLHVVADRDIPSDVPDADDPIMHGAGDCWQEVWHVWPELGSDGKIKRLDGMRAV